MFRNLFVTLSCLAGLVCAVSAMADDDSDLSGQERRTDRTAASGEKNVVDRIAADFAATFGSEEEARQVINNLRDGTTPVKSDGTMGYGEIYISLALAKAYAEKNSLSIDQAMTEVLSLRADGAGWGNVAKKLDLKLGPVVSRMRSGNDKMARSSERVRAKTEKPESRGHDAKPDRPERAAKAERPEKPERPARAERPERPERPERADRS